MNSEPTAPEMTTTTPATAEGSAETSSSNNGKRDRPDDTTASDEDTSEPTTKLLKSSDDSDEKESSSGGASPPATDSTNNNSTEKEAAVAASRALGMKDTTDSTAADEDEEEEAEEEQPDVQIDREGEDPNIDNPGTNSNTANPATTPNPALPAPPSAIPMNHNPDTAHNPGTESQSAAGVSNSNNNDPPPPAAASAPVDPNAQATLTNPEQMVEERGEVSALYVGRVIGKGGEMIRDLQARSGARIDVDQNVPQGMPRVITYRGTRETVDFAKQLVHMLSVQNVHENDLPLGQASQEILVIPSMTVGKVIGRGGEMIRELQSRSHGKIQIDHSGTSGLPQEHKQVTITGTLEAVTKAKEMVLFLVANPMMDAQLSLNILMDDKIRGKNPWGSGPPYYNLPSQGVNMQPNQLPPQYQQMTQTYGGYAQASQQGGYAAQLQQPQAYGVPPPDAYVAPTGQQAYPPAMAFGGRETDIVYASKQFMGRIIGTKGITVNDLQRRSGCDIQINQDVLPGQDCEIVLKGSAQGIALAKQMIQEIIEIGPQHPYAGGMDSYGGGGAVAAAVGGYGTYPQQQPQQQTGYYQQQQGYGGQQAAYMQHGGYGQGQPPQQHQPSYGGYHGAHHQQMAPQQQYGGGYHHGHHAQPPMGPPQQSAWKSAAAPDGQVYYYNEQTGETQWEKPAGMP